MTTFPWVCRASMYSIASAAWSSVNRRSITGTTCSARTISKSRCSAFVDGLG